MLDSSRDFRLYPAQARISSANGASIVIINRGPLIIILLEHGECLPSLGSEITAYWSRCASSILMRGGASFTVKSCHLGEGEQMRRCRGAKKKRRDLFDMFL